MQQYTFSVIERNYLNFNVHILQGDSYFEVAQGYRAPVAKECPTKEHAEAVAAFYNDWETQDYTEYETFKNGCIAKAVIDGVTYLDCELYGPLNSRDNAEDVRTIIEDKKKIA